MASSPATKLADGARGRCRNAVNPNTVLKAYRELEREGLAVGRPGQGTFIQRSLRQVTPAGYQTLRRRLQRWILAAREAGLDDDGIMDAVRDLATTRARRRSW